MITNLVSSYFVFSRRLKPFGGLQVSSLESKFFSMFSENNTKFLSLSAGLKVPNGLKQVEKDTNKTLVSAPQVWTYFTPKHVLCTFFGKPAIFYGSSVVRYRDWQFILGFNSLLWGWTSSLWIRRCGALWVWTRLAKKSDFLVTHHTKTRKKRDDEKSYHTFSNLFLILQPVMPQNRH